MVPGIAAPGPGVRAALLRARRLDVASPEYHQPAGAVSSAGRAPALQAGGRRFEPVTAHQRIAREYGHFGCIVRDLDQAIGGY